LYASGNTDILKESKCCAVVGTRNPSEWSITQTKNAVRNLVSEHFVIVSGLAKGIDTTAHQTALDTNGKTSAVLGCGIDVFYPQENKDLQNEIKRKGLLVSEYPFGKKIQSVSLQKRDKIIVGLSQETLIVETSQKGGTMNAYRAILEQKKRISLFVPPLGIKGNFDGNRKIIEERKTQLCCFSNGQDVNFEALKEC
jgi:DNA processing protein